MHTLKLLPLLQIFVFVILQGKLCFFLTFENTAGLFLAVALILIHMTRKKSVSWEESSEAVCKNAVTSLQEVSSDSS